MLDIGIFTALGLLGGLIFSVIVLWTLVWKGYALWIAAREKAKWWFIFLLILNTAGILEIIYIFAFSRWGKDWRGRRKNKRD